MAKITTVKKRNKINQKEKKTHIRIYGSAEIADSRFYQKEKNEQHTKEKKQFNKD